MEAATSGTLSTMALAMPMISTVLPAHGAVQPPSQRHQHVSVFQCGHREKDAHA